MDSAAKQNPTGPAQEGAASPSGASRRLVPLSLRWRRSLPLATSLPFRAQRHVPRGGKDVMTDLYRDDQPDPQDIGRFEWQTILAYMGASEDEIADVQTRMRRRK